MAWKVKNSGSAEFRGPHSCRVEFQLKNTATGKTIRDRKTMYVKSNTKKEKARCIRERRAELESGLRLDADTITFGQYADEWLSLRRVDPGIAPRTYSKDVYRVRMAKLHFEDMVIGEITRVDVKRFQTAIMTADEDGKAPTISGKPISGTTARGVRTTLKQIFQEAVRDNLILTNPCDDLKAPSNDTVEKEPLTPAQAAKMRALLDSGTPRPTLIALRLCLFAGLRRSEVAGLKWSDYDPQAGTITVRRSLDTETLDFKPPKTKAGYRTIPLDQGTIDYLNRFKAEQTKKLLAKGLSVPDACICATAETKYMHPENITRSIKRFGKANGFPEITPHLLRHTYCTLLFAAGADLKTVQYLMGHDDPSTTLKIYTHYIDSNGVKATAAVGAMMDSLPASNLVTLEKPKGRWGLKADVA